MCSPALGKFQEHAKRAKLEVELRVTLKGWGKVADSKWVVWGKLLSPNGLLREVAGGTIPHASFCHPLA